MGTENGDVAVISQSNSGDELNDHRLELHSNAVFDVSYSCTMTLFASCSGDRSTVVYDIPSHKTLWRIGSGRSTVKCVKFHVDNGGK